MIGFLEIDYS